MTNSDDFTQEMLDLLYGLLDGPEAEAARAKAQTPEGRAAMQRAESYRALMAQAAKLQFPEARFSPPVAPAASPTPAKWGRYRVLGWFVAAAVLAAVSAPTAREFAQVSHSWSEARVARAKALEARTQFAEASARAQKELATAQQHQQRLWQDYSAKTIELESNIEKARQEARVRPLNVVVSGPAAITPGAPNFFEIETLERGQRSEAQLFAKVTDQAGRVVFEQPPVRSRGLFTLQLPPDLPLTPDRELQLEVGAIAPGGQAKITQELPLAPPVYLTHLATDKPMYQPGETVRFRALILDRFRLQPPREPLQVSLAVLDPQGAELATFAGPSQLKIGTLPELPGMAAAEFPLPDSAAGGEYTLKFHEGSGHAPDQVRKFIVNKYQPAQLQKELEFTRKSYGPGDEVIVMAKASNVRGPLVNQPVDVSAQVDGTSLPVTAPKTTDAQGGITVKFALPKVMERGDASIRLAFTDGGAHETLLKPVPVVLNKLNVEFFPEGGDLVAGVANRVYFQARTPLGRPAELKARLLDGSDKEIAKLETLTDDTEPGINQGQGRFTFTPQAGQKYHAVVDQPAGVTIDGALPAVKPEGVVLAAGQEESKDTDSLKLTVTNVGGPRTLVVGAYARGRLLDHRRIAVEGGQSQAVNLAPTPGFGGVTRVTVFEERGQGRQQALVPVAERLVYRTPSKKIALRVDADKKEYAPGEKVQLKVAAQDEAGKPAVAIAMLGVVNNSVVVMADEKTWRSMPTHFLLTGEVEKADDFEHVDVLLGSHPKAARALDLLLGVQGWRRFAEKGPAIPAGEKSLTRTGFAMPTVKQDVLQATIRTVVAERKPAITALKNDIDESATLVQALTRQLNDTASAKEVNAAERTAEQLLGVAQVMSGNLRDRLQRSLPWVIAGIAVFALVGVVLAQGAVRKVAALAVGGIAVGGCAALIVSFNNMGAGVDARPTAAPNARVTGHAKMAEAKEEPMAERNAIALGMPGGDGAIPRDAAAAPAMPAPAGPGAAVAALPAPDAAPVEGVAAGVKLAKPAAPATRSKGGPTADAKRLVGRLDEAKRNRPEPNPERRDLGVQAGDRLRKRGPVQAADDLRDRRGFGGGRGGRGFAQLKDFDIIPVADELPPFVVREFAHVHKPSADGVRDDFTETVFWHPALVVGDAGTTVSFDLSDAVTRYQVIASAHTGNGRLGATKAEIVAVKPLTVESKLPVEITAGDRLEVPVTISNGTAADRPLKLTMERAGLVDAGPPPALDGVIAAHASDRRLFKFMAAFNEGTARLRFKLNDDDAVEHKLAVVPDGFPISGSMSDELRGSAKHVIARPAEFVKDTFKVEVAVYPSPLADLQRGLDGLLRDPYGCFEQTSTTNYPNTLILDYLRETRQANPAAAAKAQRFLDNGYKRLTSFEVPAGQKREGFEWFGQAPAHEALTAYGLLQFRDMARVADVDPAMLARTRNYLMSRRDGKGGFQRNSAALDHFGRATEPVTNAYIVWALTESGREDDVTAELDRLQQESQTVNDPYFLALVANSLFNRDRVEPAKAILTRLVAAQQADGSFDGAEKSITGSQGQPLKIETTALAVLAWLKAGHSPEYSVALRNGVKWIGRQRQGTGSFGPTQSTIMALKALVAYARANKQPPEAGEFTVRLGDRVLATKAFTAATQDAVVIDIPDAEKIFAAGDNEITIATTGKNMYPYTLSFGYQTRQPPSAATCAVRVDAKLEKTTLNEGDSTRLLVKLENVSKQGQGMTTAIIGLPAGLKLPDDFKQLRDLARLRDGKPGPIAYWELRGRELILYWRDLAPDAKVDLALDVIAHVPGKYAGPASRAYLYYDPAAKHWIAPLEAVIKAK